MIEFYDRINNFSGNVHFLELAIIIQKQDFFFRKIPFLLITSHYHLRAQQLLAFSSFQNPRYAGLMLECTNSDLLRQYEKLIFLAIENIVGFRLENRCRQSIRVFDQIWRDEMGSHLGHKGKGIKKNETANFFFLFYFFFFLTICKITKKETLQNAGWTENSNFLIISYKSTPGKSYFRCNQGENACFRGEYADDKNESSSVFVVKHTDR